MSAVPVVGAPSKLQVFKLRPRIPLCGTVRVARLSLSDARISRLRWGLRTRHRWAVKDGPVDGDKKEEEEEEDDEEEGDEEVGDEGRRRNMRMGGTTATTPTTPKTTTAAAATTMARVNRQRVSGFRCGRFLEAS